MIRLCRVHSECINFWNKFYDLHHLRTNGTANTDESVKCRMGVVLERGESEFCHLCYIGVNRIRFRFLLFVCLRPWYCRWHHMVSGEVLWFYGRQVELATLMAYELRALTCFSCTMAHSARSQALFLSDIFEFRFNIHTMEKKSWIIY